MKKLLVLILTALLLVGCENVLGSLGDELGDENPTGENPGDNDSLDDGLWSDAGTSYSVVSLSNLDSSTNLNVRSVSRSSDIDSKVFFRSSDVEFWSIDSISDIENIYSSKYDIGNGTPNDYASGQSLEYYLGDSLESVVFSPYSDNTQELGSGLNAYWQARTENFIASGSTEINMIRLDVGSGAVTFIINGEEKSLQTASGSSLNGIDANSIIFIDRQYLSNPVLVERSDEAGLNSGTLTAEDLDVDQDTFNLLQLVHQQSNTVDNETPLDVNGALYIPMTPIVLNDFDPLSQHIALEISWPIANAIHERNGEYFADNRVGKTPFNFDMILNIEDGASSDGSNSGDTGYGENNNSGSNEINLDELNSINNPTINYFDDKDWISIDSVELYEDENSLYIKLNYTTSQIGKFSIFNPPNGDILSIQGDLDNGSGTVIEEVDKANISEITMLLYPGNDFSNDADRTGFYLNLSELSTGGELDLSIEGTWYNDSYDNYALLTDGTGYKFNDSNYITFTWTTSNGIITLEFEGEADEFMSYQLGMAELTLDGELYIAGMDFNPENNGSSSSFESYLYGFSMGTYIDSNLEMAINGSFDITSIENSFSITPAVDYSIYMRYFLNGADALSIEFDDFEPNTTYTLTFSTDLIINGNNISEPWEHTFTTGEVREYPIPTLDRPTITNTEHFPTSADNILTWDSIDGAVEYEVSENTSELADGSYTTYTTTETSFNLVESGNQYYYRVRALDGSGGVSEWSRIFFIEASNE